MASKSLSSPKASSCTIVPRPGTSVKERNQRSHAIPVPVMVLSTLGFLATGTFQREIGDRSGISQPTFSRNYASSVGSYEVIFSPVYTISL